MTAGRSSSPNFARRTNRPTPGPTLSSPFSTSTFPRSSTISRRPTPRCPRRGCSRTSNASSATESVSRFAGSKTTRSASDADGDRALARVEAEELRRLRREQVDHPVERDPARADAEVVDHLQPVLEARAAVRDLREVVFPERLLPVPEERAVVGRDRRERVGAHRVPEHVVVGRVARRAASRRTSRPRSRAARGRRRRRRSTACTSRPRRPSPASRARRDRVDRLLARDVDDVERAAGDARRAGSPGSSPRPRARAGGSARGRRGSVFPAASASLDEHVDRVAVLRVHHHERAARRAATSIAPKSVSSETMERALVRHEELVRGDALVGQRRELLERAALVEVGDGDVEAVVDQRLAVRLRVPGLERLRERLALALDAEVDVAGRAAERRRRLARTRSRRSSPCRRTACRGACAGRCSPGGRSLPVASITRSAATSRSLADQRHPLAVDVDVRDRVVGGRHDAPAANQNRHGALPVVRVRGLLASRARAVPRSTCRRR